MFQRNSYFHVIYLFYVLGSVWAMPHYLTQELLNELRQIFNKYDKDGDGNIDIRELRNVLIELGHEPTEADLYEYMDAADHDGDHQMDFRKFLQAMAPRLRDIESDENLRYAFEVFDRQGFGYFTAHDVRIVMATMGEVITDDESALIIGEMGAQNESNIGLKEFLAYMHLGGPGTAVP